MAATPEARAAELRRKLRRSIGLGLPPAQVPDPFPPQLQVCVDMFSMTFRGGCCRAGCGVKRMRRRARLHRGKSRRMRVVTRGAVRAHDIAELAVPVADG